jgi:excinuclease UvrABC nuclease subunit
VESLSSFPRSYAKVRARLAALPETPGVYLFRDAAGQIIYVGKSVCLRKRVRSYFYTRQDDSSKLRRLRHEIRSVEWIRTGSELEALLLESRLVKQNQPRFNVFLRHYRHYPFIKVDLRDAYPRLEITRHLERDGALYYGPFHNGRGVQQVIDALADALRLRTCDGAGGSLPGSRPCLRRDLGRCMAPCTERGTDEVYRQAVAEACGLFEGRDDRVFRILTDRMERAAAHLQFETAARLRDAFLQIRQLVGKQQALVSAVQRLNLVAVCPSSRAERLELFLFSAGRLVMQRELTRAQVEERPSLDDLLRELAARYAEARAAASFQVEQEVVDQINIIADWLKNRTGEGRHRELPEQPDHLAPGGEGVTALAGWLRDAAAAVLPHSGHDTPRDERRTQLALELDV